MTSTELIKTSEKSLNCENKLELETHHSGTIFCDMMSPDEWKSSLPLIFQQDDVASIVNGSSPKSPSNSIENLVLELESSQDEILSPILDEYPDNMLLKPPSSSLKFDKELVCNMDINSSQILCDMMEGVQESDCLGEILLQNDEPKSHASTDTAREDNNQGKSPDPLSVMLLTAESTSSNACDHPPSHQLLEPSLTVTTKESEAEESSPTITIKKNPVQEQLTNRLAKVVHCNFRNGIENINQKAISTISTLQQQACELMSTYSQLKLQNDELVQKQNQLHLEQSSGESTDPNPFSIEVLVLPSGESKKALGSATLYHHIPIEDGQIPTFPAEDFLSEQDIIEEPYEEQYDPQPNICPDPKTSDTIPCKYKKLPCQLGCVCSSLHSEKLPVEHCKNPNCMLETTCSQFGDPSHIPKIVSIGINTKDTNDVKMDQLKATPSSKPTSVRSRSKVPAIRPKKSVTDKKQRKTTRRTSKVVTSAIRWDPAIDANDVKLKQECVVLLPKFDRTKYQMERILRDVKLRATCSVLVKRLQLKPDQAIYCMEHHMRNCLCFTTTPIG